MFQQDTGASFNDNAIAWKVIQNCGIGDFNPFAYPMMQQVSVIDAWGNYSPLLDANNGDVFAFIDVGGKTGSTLTKTREIGDPNMITVRNDLAFGSSTSPSTRMVARWRARRACLLAKNRCSNCCLASTWAPVSTSRNAT